MVGSLIQQEGRVWGKRVGWWYRYFSELRASLYSEYMKIWCNIQVKMHRFRQPLNRKTTLYKRRRNSKSLDLIYLIPKLIAVIIYLNFYILLIDSLLINYSKRREGPCQICNSVRSAGTLFRRKGPQPRGSDSCQGLHLYL